MKKNRENKTMNKDLKFSSTLLVYELYSSFFFVFEFLDDEKL